MNRKYLILFWGVLLFTLGCKKGNNDETHYGGLEDQLTYEQDSVFAAATISNPPYDSVIGADGNSLKQWLDTALPGWNNTLSSLKTHPLGSTPEQQRVELINKIMSTAYQLSQKKADPNSYPKAGPHSPAQVGIAYSYGSSDYRQRLRPPAGNSLHRADSVHGLDCGGFIEFAIRLAGVNNFTDFATSTFPSIINAALKSSSFSNVSWVNKGKLAPNAMVTGDVIIWSQHMGIVALAFPAPQNPYIYQCNGTGSPQDRYNKNDVLVTTKEQDQAKNQLANRGVHPVDFVTATTGNGYWGETYTIWRLQAPPADTLELLTGGNEKSWTGSFNYDGCPGNTVTFKFRKNMSYSFSSVQDPCGSGNAFVEEHSTYLVKNGYIYLNDCDCLSDDDINKYPHKIISVSETELVLSFNYAGNIRTVTFK